MKIKAQILYSKNKAKIEAGFINKEKGICKCDTLALRFKKAKDKKNDMTIYMRPDEMLGVIAVCSWTLWQKMKVK